MFQSQVSRLCRVLVLPAFIVGVAGCGARDDANSNEDTSELDWIQSRTGNGRYANLTNADVADTFIFGASVIKVDDFMSNALNMVVRPTNVKLKLKGTTSAPKLDVVTADSSAEKLLTFGVKKNGSNYEVDFASAGNDLTLRSLINTLGGMYTAGDENGFWMSTGAPTVLNVAQDPDTMVVDLLHTIRQAVVKTDILGNTTLDHYVSDHAGKVTIRVFLKRKKSLPRIGGTRTVAKGKTNHVGFFGTDIAEDSDAVAIQRFALGDATDRQSSVTFYLKDVPAKFTDVAKSAVLSWNQAFGNSGVIKVATAPAALDVGDPRFNVIKWFDGLDDDINWAGVAKMMVEPDTGLVMGGNLYLNGGSVLDLYKGITAYSQRVSEGGMPVVSGTFGGVTFSRDVGERPVIPYITDTSMDYDTYMKAYYEETIAHEVGHVFGLRHNFKGSTFLTNGHSASVMDYTPRAERVHYAGPGTYDKAAIRWGYFGEVPAQTQPFCTDEDIWTYFDCSQGDMGDAVKNAINGLLDGTNLLMTKNVAVDDDVLISSLTGTLENALKIKKLSAQLPSATRADTVKKIDAARSFLFDAKPAASLTGAARTQVQANLDKLHELATKKEQDLHDAGHL